MPDKLTPEQLNTPKVTTARSRNMAAIRAKNTKPEIIVRKFLWSNGFRYRLNHRGLPGKPDIVLRKYRTCVFVNGCFWHGHGLASIEVKSEELKVKSDCYTTLQSSECCKIPHTNRAFWVKKMMRNKERDKEVQRKLSSMGWHSIVVWECELKGGRRAKTLESLAFTLNHIFLQDHKIIRYEVPEEKSHYMVAEDDSSR